MTFAGYEFDGRTRELRFGGERIPMQEQPLRILELLLEARGEVVSRERLREALWGKAHADHEHGINTAVRKLRRVLTAREWSGVRLITSAGRGYRLVVPEEGARRAVEVRVRAGQRANAAEQALLEQMPAIGAALEQATGTRVVRPGSGSDAGALLLEMTATTWNGMSRVTASLRDRAAGRERWSACYGVGEVGADSGGDSVRELGEVMQAELVRDVAVAMLGQWVGGKGSRGDRRAVAMVGRPASVGSEGYEAFLTGRFLFAQRNPKALREAKAQFELACAKEPRFALAHASLSRTCRFLTIFEVEGPSELWDAAERHARCAVELDHGLSEAQASLACVLARRCWRWLDACVAFEDALRLNPNDAETCCDYGVTLLAMGEYAEGVRCLERVLVLDPRYAVGRATVALGWLMAGRRAEAAALLRQMTAAMPDFLTAWIYLGLVELEDERWAEAEVVFRRMLTLAPGTPTFLGLLALALQRQGRRAEVAEVLRQMAAGDGARYVSPTARVLGALAGEKTAAALRAVGRVVTERDANFALFRAMPAFDGIRGRREFAETLRAMDLRDGLRI